VFVAETTCPHCGGARPSRSALRAGLAVGAALSLAACSAEQASVYGPPPVDPDARIAPSASAAPTSVGSSTAAINPSGSAMPALPVAIYGAPTPAIDRRKQ